MKMNGILVRALVIAAVLFLWTLIAAAATAAKAAGRPMAINEVAVDFPVDGGLVASVSRMKVINRHFQIGGVLAAGMVERDLDLSVPGVGDLEAETEAVVAPFLGPRVSASFHFVGVSVAYGVFWAETEITARRPGLPTMEGRKSAWGTAIYSPLLVLDFFDKKRNVVFGIGLGGFLGTSYPDLVATSATTRLTTDAHPLSTLTVHLRILWNADRRDASHSDDF